MNDQLHADVRTTIAQSGGSAELLYLDLLKKCLTRELFDEAFDRIPKNRKTPWRAMRSFGYEAINAMLGHWKLALVHSGRATGETMISVESLDNIQRCITQALEDSVPGDVIETGVWRGGAVIFMSAVLKVYGALDRTIWAADSFRGLPKPDAEKYPADKGDSLWSQSLDVSVEEVQRNFARYGLLDDRTKFLVGYFSDTIPTAPIGRLCVLRLDGDMYQSTIEVLQNLYPKLSVGGYVIVDDYFHFDSCKQATEDFRREHGISEPIERIPRAGVFWRRLK